MRRLMLAVLITALGAALCGCQDTGEVENQAYVLVLAMDRAEGDALALTARVPKIGKSGAGSEGGESGGSPYLTFSVTAPSWSQALDELQWATPRRVNLSHIEMIVASADLASQPSFPALMNAISDTPHLYTNARFVVCPGSAGAFLEAGETVIGTRLSSEIRAMLSQYSHQGFIPDVSLADACYCANGIYGDPVAIWGDEADAAEGGPASTVTASPMRQRFFGAALFRGGRFVHALSTREARLLNLIRGQGNTLYYGWDGGTAPLSVGKPARVAAGFNGDDMNLLVSLRLTAPDGYSEGEIARMGAALRDDVARLVGDCQRLGCDPFGFAEDAAGRFPTVSQWLAFDFREHYGRAALTVDVDIAHSPSNP